MGNFATGFSDSRCTGQHFHGLGDTNRSSGRRRGRRTAACDFEEADVAHRDARGIARDHSHDRLYFRGAAWSHRIFVGTAGFGRRRPYRRRTAVTAL